MRHFQQIAAFLRDTRGNIAIMSAVTFTMVIGFSAVGVDVGKVFVDRRKAQSATDLAAMAAASNLTSAPSLAQGTISQNNLTPTAPLKVELGVYTASSAVTAGSRFQPSLSAGANAARVTLQTTTPLYFGKFLVGKDAFTTTTVATATSTALASFAIGSRLLSVDGGLLNQIIGGMLGANVSLTAMDYQSLIDAKLDLFDTMNAIATRARLTGPTYSSVLNSNVAVKDVLNGMLDTARLSSASNTATRALSTLVSAASASTKVPLSSIIDAGPYNGLPIGQKPQVGVAVSALDMAGATAQIANGRNQVAINLDLNIPGLANATLNLSVGERPVGTSWITLGTQGASVHTAQTRVLLQVQVLGTGAVGTLNLPLYVEIASGTATLNAVKCGYPNIATSSVTLGVTPGVLDSWIGNVSSSDFTNFKSAPSPGPAMLASLPLLQVTGRAHATISNTSPQPVSFSYSDITAQTRKTVTTSTFTTSLVGKLLGDLSLNVNILGLGLGIPSGINQTVTGMLANVTVPLDQTLAGILGTLGVGLGQADVWVNGIRCDGAVLVN